ncbi:hypothetical protein UFOVP452_24 [uncultured Caudovirales phage]|uniref:Uncharacterized protein n=1 Tax=uncultured Caudovirales phage TaxID=2100421 RepID=A0A6J5M8X4_9CAUD|nr:hypothetical protein UFOVP452_24 [uncultured Caudovirales phage]
MANTFKKVIDRMMWAQVAPSPNAHAAAMSMAADMRNDTSRNPFIYTLHSNALLNRFNIVSKAWQSVTATPLTGGTFGAGSTIAFAPSFGAVGTIAAGATTTSVTLTTALPTAVGTNMLASRGGSGDLGFKLRIIDTVAGKTEERWIVGNTASATPTIRLETALTFTPATGARYELLCGRLFMLGAGTLAAGAFRSFEPASNTLASRSITNLPATVGTDSAMLVLDELYVPYDHKPGEGMVKGATSYDTGLVALLATAAGASSITGQATGGDAVIAANEYRNFQIRVVADPTTPGSVGQRRIIASHTAGPSPVYTLGTAWTTQPSASARFVIEQPNLIVLRTSAVTTTYTYNYSDATINNGTNSIAADAWSTTYFGAGPAANAAGNLWAPSFGIQPDPARNARHSFNFFWRGGAVTLDLLDIAGGTTGLWTSGVTYDGNVNSFGTGTTGCYAPFAQEGRYTYVNVYVASAVNQIYRFDSKNRVFSPHVPTDFIQSGTAALGGRMAAYAAIDGTDTYDVVLLQSHLGTISQELIPLV